MDNLTPIVESIKSLQTQQDGLRSDVEKLDRNISSGTVEFQEKDVERVRSVYENLPGARKQSNGEYMPDEVKAGLMGYRMMRGEAAAKKRGISNVELARFWQDKELEASYVRKAELIEDAASSDEGKRSNAFNLLGAYERCEALDKLYPVGLSSEFSGPKYGNNCLDNLGIGTIPFEGHEMKYLLMDNLTGGGFVANCKAGPVQDLDVDAIKLKRRKQDISVCICNENLDHPTLAWEALIAEHSQRQILSQQNYWYMRGRGIADAPLGLHYWAEFAGNRCLMDTISETDTDEEKVRAVQRNMSKLKYKVQCKGKSDNLVVAIHCRTKLWLETLFVDGRFVFADQLANGTFCGMPYCATTDLPDNLAEVAGTAGNETEIYVFDPTSIKRAQASSFQFEVHMNASFEDAKGNTRHGAQEGLTLFKGTAYGDLAVECLGSRVALGYGVTWGALAF